MPNTSPYEEPDSDGRETDAEAMRWFLMHRTAPEGEHCTQWDVYLATYDPERSRGH